MVNDTFIFPFKSCATNEILKAITNFLIVRWLKQPLEPGRLIPCQTHTLNLQIGSFTLYNSIKDIRTFLCCKIFQNSHPLDNKQVMPPTIKQWRLWSVLKWKEVSEKFSACFQSLIWSLTLDRNEFLTLQRTSLFLGVQVQERQQQQCFEPSAKSYFLWLYKSSRGFWTIIII